MMLRTYNYLLPVLTVLLVLNGTAQNSPIGLWKGVDQGEVGYVSLDENGYAFFVVDQDTLGGEQSIMNGEEVMMKYELNETDEPKELDFVVYLISNEQEVKRLRGIYQVYNQDRMTLCVNFESGERPNNMDEGDCIELENTAHAGMLKPEE